MARIAFFSLLFMALVAFASAGKLKPKSRVPIIRLRAAALRNQPTSLTLPPLPFSAAPTFCKCTCFKNSTIIPLGPEHQSSDTDASLKRAFLFGSDFDVQEDRRTASASCSECTKAFCLSQGIDFCENADEDDVTTQCFKRDSNKDRIIVWGFIVGTVGLLGYAIFKRIMEWRSTRNAFSRENLNYVPVGAR
ncbi:hypothetical protein N3K66_004778 [Trichothecium roseum]|uniref:Uncharacterized protein n=1 Tax=Trichothecium roseum TaxID=47278 RepID=A0ACC0V4Y1_9HYPO|nr:hypothetical protein N3K66_004778 [Trichothecium roseum]